MSMSAQVLGGKYARWQRCKLMYKVHISDHIIEVPVPTVPTVTKEVPTVPTVTKEVPTAQCPYECLGQICKLVFPSHANCKLKQYMYVYIVQLVHA